MGNVTNSGSNLTDFSYDSGESFFDTGTNQLVFVPSSPLPIITTPFTFPEVNEDYDGPHIENAKLFWSECQYNSSLADKISRKVAFRLLALQEKKDPFLGIKGQKTVNKHNTFSLYKKNTSSQKNLNLKQQKALSLEKYFSPTHKMRLALLHIPLGTGATKKAKLELDLNTNQFFVRCTNIEPVLNKAQWLIAEAKIQKRLNKENEFVKVIDWHSSNNKTRIITEYCNVGTFNTFLIQNPTIQELITIFQDTLLGLKKLEENRIVHNDIKQENIFLTRDKEGQLHAKIGDFDLAGELGDLPIKVMGSFVYMNPRKMAMALSGSFDPSSLEKYCGAKSDLWSFGIVCYEVVFKKTIISGLNLSTIQNKRELLEKFPKEQKTIHDNINSQPGSTSFDSIMKEFISSILILDVNKRPSAAEAYIDFCNRFRNFVV